MIVYDLVLYIGEGYIDDVCIEMGIPTSLRVGNAVHPLNRLTGW